MQVKLVISYLPFLVSERQNFMEKSLKSDTKLSAEDGVNTLMSKIFDECEIFLSYRQKSV